MPNRETILRASRLTWALLLLGCGGAGGTPNDTASETPHDLANETTSERATTGQEQGTMTSGYDQWQQHVQAEDERVIEQVRSGGDGSVRYYRRDDADEVALALRASGGPAPLGYRRGVRLAVDPDAPEIEWTLEPGRGDVILLDASRRARLRVGASAYVAYLGLGYLGLVGTRRDDPVIQVDVVRLADLAPLSDEAPAGFGTWRMSAPPLWTHTFAVDLDAGRHPGLAGRDAPLRGRIQAVTWARVNGQMSKVCFAVDLASGDVEVSHLSWFNAEPRWDREAQGLLRVVAPRAGGDLYAEVLRAGIARLSPDGERVVEWVRVDPFWGSR